MRLFRSLALYLAVTCFSLLIVAPAAAQNALITWNSHAVTASIAGRPPASSAVLVAIAQVAMFDAVAAVEGGLTPYAAHVTATLPASVDAAVAAAAYYTLAARVPLQQSFLTTQFTASLAGIPDGAAKDNGIAAGRRVAEAILALRSDDGFDNVVAYVQPPTGPGVWEPTLPPPAVPIDVKLRYVRPLTFASPSDFRPDGPLSLTSTEYAEQLAEVQAFGATFSAVRTADQTDIAWFWTESVASQWNRVARTLALDRNLTLHQTARLLTLVSTAMADAGIACWDAKYHYNFWRPIHAITCADTDDNRRTQQNLNWTSLLNVNHPEYPSGHGCLSGAVLEVLSEFVGPKPFELTVESTAPQAIVKVRHYRSAKAALREVLDARVYGGLHFRNSLNVGVAIGRRVAKHVLKNFFRETPE